MKTITTTIFFENDFSVGLKFETYTMEIPDFISEWTETEEMLVEFIEEKRKQIKELYMEFRSENVTQVLFQWEIEGLVLRLEEDTCDQILKEGQDEERRMF